MPVCKWVQRLGICSRTLQYLKQHVLSTGSLDHISDHSMITLPPGCKGELVGDREIDRGRLEGHRREGHQTLGKVPLAME